MNSVYFHWGFPAKTSWNAGNGISEKPSCSDSKEEFLDFALHLA